MYNWKVRIRDSVAKMGKEIIIYRDTHNQTEMLQGDKIITLDEGAYTKPTLYLDEEMFKAMVNAIHTDYKPSEGKYTEGKLTATESHLSDLRQLLKLK